MSPLQRAVLSHLQAGGTIVEGFTSRWKDANGQEVTPPKFAPNALRALARRGWVDMRMEDNTLALVYRITPEGLAAWERGTMLVLSKDSRCEECDAICGTGHHEGCSHVPPGCGSEMND